MSSDHKKPGMAFWATVGLVVALVGYPLSFGPACWIASYFDETHPMLVATYLPLFDALTTAGCSFDLFYRFGGLGMKPGSVITLKTIWINDEQTAGYGADVFSLRE